MRCKIASTRSALIWALLSAATLPVATAPAQPPHKVVTPARPDVILIVLDDVGFSDLGAFGSEIRTPNIDALARDGLRYNRFDSRAVCSATRAALLTGRNNQTVRMEDLPADRLPAPGDLSKDRGEMPLNAPTVAQTLHDAGYATYAVGKWHIAPDYEDGTPGRNGSWPLQRGFDRYYGFISGWTDQYHPDLIQGNRSLPKPQRPGYHLSVDLVDHAIANLAGTPRDQPSFTYLAFGAGHAPIQVPRPYVDHYADVYEKGWDALRVERVARMKRMGIIPGETKLPPINPGDRPWSSLTPAERKLYARFMAVYAGFIEHADEQVGRLIRYLKDSGKYDNTLIILLSDNGAAAESGQKGSFERLYAPNLLTPEQMLARIDELGTDKTQPQYQRPWAMAGVTPLRRYKAWPYAGGVRTPLIVTWPKVIRDKGAIRRQFVDAIDIAPSIVDAAGARYPARADEAPVIPVAGRSIRASFTRANAPSARQVQFFELRGNRAITSGPWRAVAMHKYGTDFAQDRWALFNTARDFSESTDLSAIYPVRLAELRKTWWREARKYSSPPLIEPPERFARRKNYDDAFLETGPRKPK